MAKHLIFLFSIVKLTFGYNFRISNYDKNDHCNNNNSNNSFENNDDNEDEIYIDFVQEVFQSFKTVITQQLKNKY